MEVRYQNSQHETAGMGTADLRKNYLVEELMVADKCRLVYSHFDRVIIGGAMPVAGEVVLYCDAELRAEYFLERRELGIINVGGSGVVKTDAGEFSLNKFDCLYLGKGCRDVRFTSANKDQPAVYYLLSAPAHQSHPAQLLTREEADPANMGDQFTANRRTIYKYIHPGGLKSCQLVMGLTVLEEGSVWNTMPSHTHSRRMEAYFYFDVPGDQRVFHLMGQPQETRHLVVANYQAVISPPWSIHSGCGTSNYGFIWGMAGENYTYTDMDPAPVQEMR